MNAANMFDKLLSNLSNHKRSIIETISVIAFFIAIIMCVDRCSEYKRMNDANLISLVDSVEYYKGKLGNEVAMKSLVVSEYSNLKQINDSLYNLVNTMNIKKPSLVVGSTVYIDNLVHDTLWVMENPKVDKYPFDFSDKWRELSGYVSNHDDTLELYIEKDKVTFEYALALKDNKVYMTSDNPHVKFKHMTGLQIEKEKPKRFGIGPSAFVGFGNKGITYGVGVGIQYSLIRF